MCGAAMVTVASVSCAGAGGGAEPEGTHRGSVIEGGAPVAGGRLVFGLTAESSGWSPVTDQWALDGHFVASAIYDPLMAVAPDRSIVPELAEVVEHDEDFLRWTIHLRRGVRFHDGTPLDAAAVKANLDASRRGLGAVALAPVASVDVVDEDSVAVVMRTPWSAFPASLAGQQGYIAAPRSLEDGTASARPVGTGPFVFERWVPDGHLDLSRNPRYWQEGKPYLSEIQFRPVPDNTSRSAALVSGSLDLMFTYEPGDVARFQDDPRFQVLTDLRAEETAVVLNAAHPPFDDVSARRALVLGTDRARLVDALGAGVLEPADGPFSPGEAWYDADTGHPGFDPVAARAEVDAYRQRTGKPLQFRLTTFPDATRLRQAQALQQQWAEVGAEARIETLDQASFITPLITGRLEAAVISNFGTADPDFNHLFWHSSLARAPGEVSINFSHTRDPAIDEALDAARRTDDRSTRAEAYGRVVRRLNDEAAYVWLYRTPTTVVASDRIRGLASVGDAGFARPDGKPWLAHLWMVDG